MTHRYRPTVGTANRADVRRLRQLEEQNSSLIEKLGRQQRQLRGGSTSRDKAIRRLEVMLIQRVGHCADESSENREVEAIRTTMDAARCEQLIAARRTRRAPSRRSTPPCRRSGTSAP